MPGSPAPLAASHSPDHAWAPEEPALHQAWRENCFFHERGKTMATQTLALVVVTGTIGLAAAVLFFAMTRRTAAVQQDHVARNDQSVVDTWENEGGNAE